MVDRSLIWLGRILVIRYMRYKNSYPAQVYFDGADVAVKGRFMALARMLADTGRLPDRVHGHFLKAPFDKIFELKPHGSRFYGFFFHRANTFYVTNGADKAKNKEQVADYQRALGMMGNFFEEL